MRVVGLRYIEFSTGRYGSGKKFQGVCLQFESEGNGTIYHAIFNAKLDRARSSEKGRARSALPGRQFRVTKKHAFYKFWLGVGLKLPPRLSSFHDYMGKLKPLVLTGEVSNEKNKLKNNSIRLMVVPSETVQTDKPQTQAVQEADNWHTKLPYKESTQGQYLSTYGPDQATGPVDYERSLKGNADSSKSVRWPKTYEELQRQSVEDWLLDYEETEKGLNE